MTIAELNTPALLVDVDRLDRNITTMAESFAGTGVALRPHVKTSKCWAVVRRQFEAGVAGFTCSTAAEVAWLDRQSVRGLLWAHIPIGPRKVAFTVDTVRRGADLTVALDSVEAARPLARAAAAAGVTVAFVLEVNTGHGRLGVDPDRAIPAAASIASLPGLRLRGVLTHEGHVSAESERSALERAGGQAGAALVRTAEALRKAGHEIDIVSVGSTPGVTSAPFASGVTEARPGTYVYYDANQIRLGSCTLDDCALTVLARVVSVQRAGRAIIDAGVKAMSSDTISVTGSVGLVVDLAGNPLPDITFAEANEEHGFLLGPGASKLQVGGMVRLVPNHACGTTNMWSRVYAVRGGDVVNQWPITARY
ncbi:MAG: alanine racemase [Kibdelosporangium sp.]